MPKLSRFMIFLLLFNLCLTGVTKLSSTKFVMALIVFSQKKKIPSHFGCGFSFSFLRRWFYIFWYWKKKKKIEKKLYCEHYIVHWFILFVDYVFIVGTRSRPNFPYSRLRICNNYLLIRGQRLFCLFFCALQVFRWELFLKRCRQ